MEGEEVEAVEEVVEEEEVAGTDPAAPGGPPGAAQATDPWRDRQNDPDLGQEVDNPLGLAIAYEKYSPTHCNVMQVCIEE